jgi:hypothetical protein
MAAHSGAAASVAPTRRREALENAWREAEGAEHADAAGRPSDRDVRIAMALMWAAIAQAEKESR